MKRMARRFTAQMQVYLAMDDMSQSLHGSGTVAYLTVSSSKHLVWMRIISANATVLFICGPGAGNLCTVSMAVSLSSLL